MNDSEGMGARLLLLLAVTACTPAPPSTEEEHAAPPTAVAEHAPQTLKVIMQGLEADMAAAAHGLWIGDRDAVATAAGAQYRGSRGVDFRLRELDGPRLSIRHRGGVPVSTGTHGVPGGASSGGEVVEWV